MRRFSTLLVLCAWLLSSGAHWDMVQGFAWGRMIATYSRTMPISEAIRLTFDAGSLCGVCEFVADNNTRTDGSHAARDSAPATGDATKGKLHLLFAPNYVFVFSSALSTAWMVEDFFSDACARPAPPTEPPRAA